MDTQNKPRVLVLGSTCANFGPMMVGALVALEDQHYLDYVDTFCGVNYGALLALLKVVGYTARTMVTLLHDFSMFNDLYSKNNKSTLYSSEPARQKLIKLISPIYNTIPTLYDLYVKTGKSLVTVSYNVTDQKITYMNPFTHPTMSSIDAVINAFNIPLLYYQLFDQQGKLVIDGSFADPYPVHYFDNLDTQILGMTVLNNTLVKNKKNETIKLLNIATQEYTLRAINTSSKMCQHLQLRADTTNDTITLSDIASMVMSGFKQGQKLTNDNNTTNKYEYPKYYLWENTIHL